MKECTYEFKYATSKTNWTLGQTNATATVYIKFRDEAGNETSCINDTITHDDTAPTSTSITIDGGTHTSDATPNLTLAATGASEMYITNTSGCASGGSWEAYSTSKASWTLGQSNATATVHIKFRDEAGNVSSCINDTITHDDTAPTRPGITISGGSYTNDDTPLLTLSANNADERYITNTSGCSAGGTWETYSTSHSGWNLAQTNALATVYVKYRDFAGNETACVNDTITHDNTAPTDPTNFIDGDETFTLDKSPDLSWTASSDTLSGVDRYEIAIGTSSGGTDILNWT